MLVAASVVFLYYTIWTLMMVCLFFATLPPPSFLSPRHH